MIRAFIADDHLMFRQGLKTLLEKNSDIMVIGEAETGQETIREVEKLKPDVTILDVGMPGLNGIEVARRIKKVFPDAKILFLSMHADVFFSMEALKSGALGYVLKEDSITQLVDAIRAVNCGKLFISPVLEEPVMKRLLQIARESYDTSSNVLTEREKEILQLIAEGMTNQSIAESLCISVTTVDTHRKNIMSKLGIHSVAGLVKYAIKHKIVTV